MIVFIPPTGSEGKGAFADPDWEWLPRICPRCGRTAVVGHGRRNKPAHDQQHTFIRIRRAICNSCSQTITVLPAWSLPYTHYSLHARRQALSRVEQGVRLEAATPLVRDPDRMADAATLRRWCRRRIESVVLCAAWLRQWPWRIRPPTILAWDWQAAARMLLMEASPT